MCMVFGSEGGGVNALGVIARESGRPSIPETVVIEPMGRGVLGRPVHVRNCAQAGR
jgi:hypothetical protein